MVWLLPLQVNRKWWKYPWKLKPQTQSLHVSVLKIEILYNGKKFNLKKKFFQIFREYSVKCIYLISILHQTPPFSYFKPLWGTQILQGCFRTGLLKPSKLFLVHSPYDGNREIFSFFHHFIHVYMWYLFREQILEALQICFFT